MAAQGSSGDGDSAAGQDAAQPASMEDRLSGLGKWLDDMSQRGRERAGDAAATRATSVEDMRRQWTLKRRDWRHQRLEGTTARDRWEQRVDDALADLEAKLDDAATDLQAEEADDRPAYVKAVEAQLDAIGSRLDGLRATLSGAGGSAVGATQDRVDALSAQLADVRHRADEVGAQAGDSWRTVAGGVRRAVDELRAAVAEAGRGAREP